MSVSNLARALRNKLRPPPPPTAPPELSPAQQEHTLGSALLRLLLDPGWVHRRVDLITFIDADTAHRQMSVDFTLPNDNLAAELRRLRPGVVPIATLNKRDLARFSLWDETRGALPMLTAEQNGWYAAGALVALARGFAAVNHLALAPEVEEALRRIATEPTPRALLVRECLRLGVEACASRLDELGPPSAPDERVRLDRRPAREVVEAVRAHAEATTRLFAASPLIGQLTSELAQQFIVFTEIPGGVDRRRVIKFSYEEPPRAYRPPLGRAERLVGRPLRDLLVAFSWWHKTITLDNVAVGTADSYHIEIEAPPDVEILGARVTARDPGRDDPAFRAQSSGTERQRVHLRVSGAPRAVRGPVWVQLRPVRTGFLRSACVLGAVVAALLWVGQGRLTQITEKADVPGAVLLLVPTVLVAVLIRPGEHAMVTSMLFGVRALVLVSAGSALLAASVIAAGYTGATEAQVWSYAKWIATATAGAMVLSYVLPYLTPRVARMLLWLRERLEYERALFQDRSQPSIPPTTIPQ